MVDLEAPRPRALQSWQVSRALAGMKPQPELQIRGDMQARYDSVGRVLLECQRAGIAKVAFITQPPALDG